MVEEEENYVSDDDVPDNVHNRLLGAISHLYQQQKVKAPVRKESSYKVSEFHLTKVGEDDTKGKILLSNLTKVLDKRAGHAEIDEQIKKIKQRTRKLPKPLEKIEADKIERSVGYQNVRKDLNRWDAIVEQQRAAEHVSYPLPTAKVHMHRSCDFLATFSKPTELELELAESINEELKRNQEVEENSEEQEFPLSLEELKERRSMMARLRAQLSYSQAKAARQKRIKSKKYHRILRKEKMKQQIKEFEELQKTDPEAALKKLEQLEKTRAQERASLRHRSTGQWAHNLSVRAKYNKDARIALAEQLAHSRQLTQKLKNDSSDDEIISDNDDEETVVDPNNTWLNEEKTSEVQDFFDKYKKYRDEKDKKKESQVNSSVELMSGTVNILNSIRAVNNCHSTSGPISSSRNSELWEVTTPSENSNTPVNGSVGNKLISHTNKFVVTDKCANEIECTSKDSRVEKRKGCTFTVHPTSEPTTENKNKENSGKILKHKLKKVALSPQTGVWSVESVNQSNFKSASTQPHLKKKDELKAKTFVPQRPIETNRQVVRNNKVNFDEMFYDVEERLNDKVMDKVKRLKESINRTDNVKESDYIDDCDEEYGSSLKMKKQRIQIDLDEKLNESVSKDNHNEENAMQNAVERASVVLKAPTNSEGDKITGNIEPNNFFHAKPKKLHTGVINNFAAAEDHLDDEDDDVKKDGRLLTISEAFACDDVEEEFKQDKEEEIKLSAVEDVNLELPGWGSWAGPDITEKPKQKKLIMKFPKVFPRRDENKGNVVINEDKDVKLKPHLVTQLPFPFTSVKDFEASIRSPLGSTFLPQSAHRKLIKPTVSTKLGTVISPMTKDQILENELE